MNDQTIPFVKYTASGNNFVIIDETDGAQIDERDMSRLAFHATNFNFGVGCDNLLVIQRATKSVLDGIRAARGYWQAQVDPGEAEFVFRMFEPDGEEAYCCGNGLMSIAHYLHSTRKIAESSILTEVPLAKPQPVSIGFDEVGRRAWVNLTPPRCVAEDSVRRQFCTPVTETIDTVELQIELRRHDLQPYSDEHALGLRAYLTFTGEPHLVVFPESGGLSIPQLSDTIFCSSNPNNFDGSGLTRRVNFGSWLLRRIGYYLNHSAREVFPNGINVNLARVDPATGAIEYRTYERGLNRETLACGTGALAVAHVADELRGHRSNGDVVMLPHRCRWYETHTSIDVRPATDGTRILRSAPRLLCRGELALRDAASAGAASFHDESGHWAEDEMAGASKPGGQDLQLAARQAGGGE